MKKRSWLFITVLASIVMFSINSFSWTSAKRVTWNSGTSWVPRIAVDTSARIHVVWYDYTYGDPEIFYKKSTDAGETWGSQKRLTWNSIRSHRPIISTDNSDVIHVIWFNEAIGDYEIYHKKSTDLGNTWSSAKRLTYDPSDIGKVSMTIDSSNWVHIVYSSDPSGNWEIYYRKSTNTGTSWTSPQRMTWNSGSSGSPVIAADSSDNLHLIWKDKTPGNNEIFYKKSTDQGNTWSAVNRITWNSGSSNYPSFFSDSSDNLHLLWRDKTPGNHEIYYKKSINGGNTWSAVKRLTWNSGTSDYPEISVSPNLHVHAVWQDNTPGNTEIFYKSSTDLGSNWSSATRLTWDPSHSGKPDIASDLGNNVHIVWYDAKSGNDEIYYKRKY